MKTRYVLPIALGALVAAGGVALAEPDVAEHREAQVWPIALGTSGGNTKDISKRYCCSGTLGALVTDGDKLYILSNNHVLARVNQASPGELISQPGMIDQGCQKNGIVATLTRFVPIYFAKGRSAPANEVDAAIAEVLNEVIGDETVYAAKDEIIGVGVPGVRTTAAMNMRVKKSGRTTGLTRGTVGVVDGEFRVGYSTTCGGAATQIARFVNQITITGTETFSAGGDSGSLIVTDDVNNRPVGLLFAGNSTTTIACPIDAVMKQLGVRFIGESATANAAEATDNLEPVKAVKARNSDRLFEVAGVHGHGIGLAQNGQPVIKVFVTPQEAGRARAQLPAQVEGVAVEIEVADPFIAY